MPVANINQPNEGFSFSLLIFLLRYIPAKIPNTDSEVKDSRNPQWMVVESILPAKPMSALAAMIINEVATAFFIGNFAAKTRVGIIRKPPPTPTKPVSSPTKTPFSAILYLLISLLPAVIIIFFLIIEKEAAIINTANTSMMNRSLVKGNSKIVNNILGKNGTTNFRMMKMEIKLGMPK